jgi:arsenate reductase
LVWFVPIYVNLFACFVSLLKRKGAEQRHAAGCFGTMKTVFHLTQCGTCQRIIKDLKLEARGFELRDIKLQPIRPEELDAMREMSGSYASLFSKRAIKYKTMGLKDRTLTEDEYRALILDEYTFVKRPVIIVNDVLFAGNEQKTLDRLAAFLDAE